MIHSSALSMPGTKKHRAESYNRSRSQPGTRFLSKCTSKVFFENLLESSNRRASARPNLKTNSSLTNYSMSDRTSKTRSRQVSSVVYGPPSTYLRPAPTELTVKFRRAFQIISFSIYWCKFARSKNAALSTEFLSYLQAPKATENVMFDKTIFKVQPVVLLPIVRDFFLKDSTQRKFDQLESIRKCLFDIKPFTRLPLALQDKFLERAWYESYSAGRTIVRQGLATSCFYIIVSGSAIPTHKRSAQETAETLQVLKRGSTFGEQAIINNSTQTFTITSETNIELLVLWKEDFRSIFLTNERQCSDEDLHFLKHKVPFLHGFPIDRLKENQDGIQHCHFRPSEVIARDSRTMKHIFVVKKGCLSIWKKLEADGPRATSSRIIDEGKQFEEEATGDDRILFSELKLNDSINKSIFNAAKLDADVRLSRLRRTNLNEQRVLSGNSSSSRLVQEENQKVFPGLVDKRDRLQTVDYDSINASLNKKKLSIVADHLRKDLRSKSKIISPDKSLFVHVKLLTEGQHFGLADLLFPNQPSLTLISDDCECLLLHKASFIEIASDPYKQNLRRTEIPFPTDAAFYKNFHSNEVWRRLSKNVYQDSFRLARTKMSPFQRRPQKKAQETFEYQSIYIDAF